MCAHLVDTQHSAKFFWLTDWSNFETQGTRLQTNSQWTQSWEPGKVMHAHKQNSSHNGMQLWEVVQPKLKHMRVCACLLGEDFCATKILLAFFLHPVFFMQILSNACNFIRFSSSNVHTGTKCAQFFLTLSTRETKNEDVSRRMVVSKTSRGGRARQTTQPRTLV